MFNLKEQSNRAQVQEDGIDVDLLDPATRQPVAKARIAGLDSKRGRQSRRDAYRAVFSRYTIDALPEELPPDERQEIAHRILAGCLLSWEHFTSDGVEPLPLTIENAVEVFKQVPWVFDDLDAAAGSLRGFTQG